MRGHADHARSRMTTIFGIVNVTRDSFSDGGRYFTADAAIAHGERLRADGADVLDIGAESTHPDAEDVPASEEIRRLDPVVAALLGQGAQVSVDTCKPDVMAAMAAKGVHWINDVHGFRSPGALEVAAAAPHHVRFVVMFSRSGGPRAEREALGIEGLLAAQGAFVAERVEAFARVGIDRSRLVFDPGMGFFLGAAAEPSLHVLKHLPALAAHGVPLLVSVSRKSFLGAIASRPVGERGSATLAAELWAARHGAACLRTHDVAALRSALAVERAIAESR